MNFNGMNGVFGNDNVDYDDNIHNNRPINSRRFHLPIDWNNSERIVDIVCISIIAISVLFAAIFWGSFSDWLFYRVLFPFLAVAGKVIVVILIILIVAAYIRFRIRHPFGYWRY